MIGEVCGSLCHVATVAGRADAPSLARKSHHEPLAAARAPGAGESEAEDAALEIAAKLVLDVTRRGPLTGFPPGEPAFEVLRLGGEADALAMVEAFGHEGFPD